MSARQHGEYDPAKGWYSAVTTGWHRDPTKIGEVREAPAVTEYDRQEFARSKWGNGGRTTFAPVPELETLLQLRDSDRADDRAKFEKLASGRRRIQLHDYEAAKSKAGQSHDD